MTTNSQTTARDLRVQAAELRALEQSLIDRLNNLPFLIAEKKREAESRYNVQHAEVMAGRSDRLPTLDYSEAEAIAQTEPDLQAKAKQYGLDRFEMEARAYRLDVAEAQKALDDLREPIAGLEADKARIDAELRKLFDARSAADSRRKSALKEAYGYERAHARESQSDDVVRRMN